MKKNKKVFILNIIMVMFMFSLITIFLLKYSNEFSWPVKILLILISLMPIVNLWLFLIRVIKKKEKLTWNNLNDGMVFKIIQIGTKFDTSQIPSKKTGFLKIETWGLKNVIVIFPIHISCWEGITPTEGKKYKKDGNYFTEIRPL